jgi:ribonucleoside-diphosphate reductase alpha chain
VTAKTLQQKSRNTQDKQKGSVMSATNLKTVKPNKSFDDIEFQEASLDIWDKKYRLKDKQDQPVDEDIQATYDRVA